MLAEYLQRCALIRGVAVPETSYYPALQALLEDAGKGLKPAVVPVQHPKGGESGVPDFALYAKSQLAKAGQDGLWDFQRTKPERGVVEIKSVSHDLDALIQSEQVLKYLREFRHVVCTNLREWASVTLREGQPFVMERFALAESAAEFQRLTETPKQAEARLGLPFAEFLQRTLRATTEIVQPSELAAYLASFARDARHKLDLNHDVLNLKHLQENLETALGIKFEGEKGDDFFRSALVQTLFYGIFSAWVLWHEEKPDRKESFLWVSTHSYLRVPMVEALFRTSTSYNVLEQTQLRPILDQVQMVLDRVDRTAFFERFESRGAVQYFYEPFLQAFDPDLRKQMGVWYTPSEIVRYMVARVDRILKEQFGLRAGIADPNVLILDPCCGTGAYLVECLHTIVRHYERMGEAHVHGDDLTHAVTSRLFGFELLPAPFVVAHLQMSFVLAKLGIHLPPGTRAGIYLTNALTGWESKDRTPPMDTLGLWMETQGANKVKREEPILVVMGNPPYNGFAGMNTSEEERALVEIYDSGKRKGQGLNDLYVRFYAMADLRIERTGKGIVSFISNYSWLDGLSFAKMRERYLATFDTIWIDNLHGDRKISEYAPDGRTSETVFAISGQSAGIKVGTAIATMVRAEGAQSGKAFYRDFDDAKAEARRRSLLASLSEHSYAELAPNPRLGSPFKPRTVGDTYLTWHSLPDLMPDNYPGVTTARDDFLVAIDEDVLRRRVGMYFDSSFSDAELGRIQGMPMDGSRRFEPAPVRSYLLRRGLDQTGFRKFVYRPFDVRWMYYERETKLIDEKRADYEVHVGSKNRWFGMAKDQRRSYDPPVVTTSITAYHLIERGANMFGMHRKPPEATLLDLEENLRASWNLSELAWSYLQGVQREDTPQAIFYHALAILHSPAYREENEGALRQDWPRIPLPALAETLDRGLELGKRLADLLDAEVDLADELSDDPNLRSIGAFQFEGPGNPRDGGPELALRARWGYRGQGGVVMPGPGRVEGLEPIDPQSALLGEAPKRPETLTIRLNDVSAWTGISREVWQYKLGGYQVLKKWLSYREEEVLGRPLKLKEVREFTSIARRIASILSMGEALDAHYEDCKAIGP